MGAQNVRVAGCGVSTSLLVDWSRSGIMCLGKWIPFGRSLQRSWADGGWQWIDDDGGGQAMGKVGVDWKATVNQR